MGRQREIPLRPGRLRLRMQSDEASDAAFVPGQTEPTLSGSPLRLALLRVLAAPLFGFPREVAAMNGIPSRADGTQ